MRPVSSTLVISFLSFLPASSSSSIHCAYAPSSVPCPPSPLLRPANGVGTDEAAYTRARNVNSAAALSTWLSSLNAGFPSVNASSVPILGAVWSGGGYRALLNGAGVRQTLDARESNASVAGIYQALTYESGLSGGGWFLAGIAGDGYPTISSLSEDFYLPNIQRGLVHPGSQNATRPNDTEAIFRQIKAKHDAGFDVTLADAYGRLVGYNLLSGPEGGVSKHFSDIAKSPNFTSHGVPIPILTSIALNGSGTPCSSYMSPQQAQMEITPFEFGSWDCSIHAFTPTKYLGTQLRAGQPSNSNKSCTTGFDSTSLFQGTTGNIIAEAVCELDSKTQYGFGDDFAALINKSSDILLRIRPNASSASFASASYPNPFFHHASVAPEYSDSQNLHLIDGFSSGQNNPVWPHLHRNVSALIIADAFPLISNLHQNYLAARAAGLKNMPVVPSPAAYDNKTMPRFFGCDAKEAMTVVWLPGFNYVYPDKLAGGELELTRGQIEGVMANGRAAATANGTDEGWGVCVGCAVMGKQGVELPEACGDCFKRYCWN